MLKRLLPLALIVGLTLLFFHQLTFTDKILARGDTYNYFYPYWDMRNEAYRAGDFPLWTPDIFMGAPLLANPQLGTYYPPNWLTAPFRAPLAIKVSILLHAMLAGGGMLFLYRTVGSRQLLPALTASVIFTFGGYIGAHVEQINQLQGLAWMPLLFALYHQAMTGKRPVLMMLLLGGAWSMQIFSGHTQTVFVTGVGLGLYGVVMGVSQWRTGQQRWHLPRALVILLVGAILAVILAIPQLLPTLELTGMSNRGGGFNVQQATAFSLSPNAIGRALLPSYDSQLFGEYVTYLGIIGLGLAFWGIVAHPRQLREIPQVHRWVWGLLAVVGLMLAFGRFNPLYLILAELPGFNLFRVPARWLSLFTLGMAIVAGFGVQALSAEFTAHDTRRVRRFALVLLVGVGALIFLTRFVLQVDPRDVYGDATPQDSSVLLWGGTLVILLGLLVMRGRWMPLLTVGALTLELLLASLILPYNDLTPPEVYLGQRFTISHMLANQQETPVTGRMLAISRMFFDPGDIGALRQRYNRLGMDEQSQFHAFDAVKKQELLMPNLPMTWGIPSVDGFGGGILPTIYYSQFTSLLLPPDELRTVDGRLGEILAKPDCRGACIPDVSALSLADIRYIITDKVYDMWIEDVAYDTSLADYWAQTTNLPQPDFVFDEVRILHREPFEGLEAQSAPDGLVVTVTDWDTLTDILRQDHDILAVTVVDSRTDDVFLQLIPPPFERALSSDIKLYEVANHDSQRAFIASDVTILPDHWQGHEDALPLIASGEMTVIHADDTLDALSSGGDVQILDYTPAQVTLAVMADSAGYLVLKDAYYPGWVATVDGAPVMVYRANTMFRAVPIPAGKHTVVFTFAPELWRSALLLGCVAWGLCGLLIMFVGWKVR